MDNLEQSAKLVAEALTGKKADDIPDRMEDICSFVAENYRGQTVAITAVAAPKELSEAPTKEDFNGLIAKLKEANVLQ